MPQVIKSTQTTNAQVLRDETLLGRNTKLRVYNLLLDLIDSAVFYNQVKQITGTSEEDTMSQKAITDLVSAALGGTIIAETYADITALLADQANQVEGKWYRALDASADPDVDSGWAIYEKLAASTGSLNDYYFILDQESLNIVIQDASPTVKGIMKLYADLTGSNTDGTVTQSGIKAVTDLLETIIKVQNSTSKTAAVSGTDTYTAALTPAITSYVKGQTFSLTDINPNTVTNPTIAINGLAVKNLLDYKGDPLEIGNFAGSVIVMYDGTAFRMVGGGGGGGTMTLEELGDLLETADVDNEPHGLDSIYFFSWYESILKKISWDNFITVLKSILDNAYVRLTGDQTIAGEKTFSSSPLVPTESTGTNNTKAASTAFVQQEIAGTSDFATAVSCLTQLNS